MRYGISRRDVLRMAGVVGGVAVTGAIRGAWAQSSKKIEQMAPELANIISTSEPIRELATGYGGDIGPAEGPVWWAEGHYLLFNDIQTARRMKYDWKTLYFTTRSTLFSVTVKIAGIGPARKRLA